MNILTVLICASDDINLLFRAGAYVYIKHSIFELAIIKSVSEPTRSIVQDSIYLKLKMAFLYSPATPK